MDSSSSSVAATAADGPRVAVIDAFLGFLQCGIHSFLHSRGLYPDELFAKTRKYGMNVRQSVHPEINSYIDSVIANAYDLFLRDLISTAIILIKVPSQNDRILEAIYFRFDFLKNLNFSDANAMENVDRMEQDFRNTLLRLSSSTSSPFNKHLPPDATFSLVFETKPQSSDLRQSDLSFAEAVTNGKWFVESDLKKTDYAVLRHQSSSSGSSNAGGGFGEVEDDDELLPDTHPVNQFHSAFMRVNIYTQLFPSN